MMTSAEHELRRDLRGTSHALNVAQTKLEAIKRVMILAAQHDDQGDVDAVRRALANIAAIVGTQWTE